MKFKNHTSNSLISKQRISIICIQDKLNTNIKCSSASRYLEKLQGINVDINKIKGP